MSLNPLEPSVLVSNYYIETCNRLAGSNYTHSERLTAKLIPPNSVCES